MVRYQVLGTLRISGPDGQARIGSRRSRIALAWLILHGDRYVSLDSVATIVWQRAGSTDKARALLRGLAATLPPGALEVSRAQARLAIGSDEVDAARFERLVAGADNSNVASARTGLDEALALWRGEPYADLDRAPEAIGEIDRLSELYLGAVEARTALRLAGDVDYTLVAELREHAGLHPDRPRTRRQLAFALYRTDRQIEALDVLRAALRESGDPDGEIAYLQAAILRHDPELEKGEPLRR